MHCSKTALLFDHLVGNREYAWRNGEAQLLGCLEIDDQFEPRELHDRKVGRLFTFENSAGIYSGLPALTRP